MKNKIIIFSNIKGGVGKTTLCALFASYLVEKGYPVIAIDADLQASLYRHRQREKDVAPDAQIPWNVEMLDTSDSDKLVQVVNKLKSVPGIVLKPGIYLQIGGCGDNPHIIRCRHRGRDRHIRQGVEVCFIR